MADKRSKSSWRAQEPPDGFTARKVHPKLRMMRNCGPEVSRLRAERSPALIAQGPEGETSSLREPDAVAEAPPERRSVLESKRSDDEWEEVGNGPVGSRVNVFIRTTKADAYPRDSASTRRKPAETNDLPPDTARREDLVTVELPLSRLDAVSRDPSIQSIELGERVDFSPPLSLSIVSGRARPSQSKRLRSRAKNNGGADVLLGFVDVGGFDFAHEDFLTNGQTRFIRIWDQGGSARRKPRPYGYGSEIRFMDMQAAIEHAATEDFSPPATELEPQSLRLRSSHATHVASIAGGNRGVAPKAWLAGVSLSLPTEETDRRTTFFDSTRLVHAIDYLFRLGDSLSRQWNKLIPVCVNVSLGTNGHAHDGSSPVSRWLEHALSVPARAVCVAAGNSGRERPTEAGDFGSVLGRLHTSGRIPAAGLTRDLEWVVMGNGNSDLSENELEIWYSMQDRFAIEVRPPGSRKWYGPIEPGDFVENEMLDCGTFLSVYNELYSPANGLNYIACYLSPLFSDDGVIGVKAGTWTVRLHGSDVRDGFFHAWIERDDPRRFRHAEVVKGLALPSYFADSTAVDDSTVSSLATGPSVIGVANLDLENEAVHPTSSQGPTRDGRPKPEIAAPGTDIVAASGFNTPGRQWASMTGTSMASPYVAGVAALMFGIEPRLTATQVAGILRRSAKPLPGSDYRWQNDSGFGAIDAALCLKEAARINRRSDKTR